MSVLKVCEVFLFIYIYTCLYVDVNFWGVLFGCGRGDGGGDDVEVEVEEKTRKYIWHED